MSQPDVRFFNTMGRRLEPFQPLEAGRVRMYTCGPTVYNHAHIGNLRAFVFEDLLRRSLDFLGFDVYQVMNLTDVDDKTIRGALDRGLSLDDYTAEFIASFFADLDALHVERAECYPRATEHIGEMIEMIEALIARDFAYARDGSVYFRIAADDDYGRLSGIDLTQTQQGARVASDEYEKDDVRDFVLWKAHKGDEPSWDSPWGSGRPGWHIECSAMSRKYLGPSFDIHCGGVDNIFPHHENEIAQSESANDETFVHTWLHAEHLIVDGEKMSKSVGNQYTLGDVLAKGYPARSVRYVYLSVHYRQKLNFTFEAVDAASAALRRVDEMRMRVERASVRGAARDDIHAADERLREDFAAALADDLNSAAALAALFVFVKSVNKVLAATEGVLGDGDQARIVAALAHVDQVLGVLDPTAWEHGEADGSEGGGLDDAAIEQLVADRQVARADRDFTRADALRDRLVEANIVIEDTPTGTIWRRG